MHVASFCLTQRRPKKTIKSHYMKLVCHIVELESSSLVAMCQRKCYIAVMSQYVLSSMRQRKIIQDPQHCEYHLRIKLKWLMKLIFCPSNNNWIKLLSSANVFHSPTCHCGASVIWLVKLIMTQNKTIIKNDIFMLCSFHLQNNISYLCNHVIGIGIYNFVFPNWRSCNICEKCSYVSVACNYWYMVCRNSKDPGILVIDYGKSITENGAGKAAYYNCPRSEPKSRVVYWQGFCWESTIPKMFIKRTIMRNWWAVSRGYRLLNCSSSTWNCLIKIVDRQVSSVPQYFR